MPVNSSKSIWAKISDWYKQIKIITWTKDNPKYFFLIVGFLVAIVLIFLALIGVIPISLPWDVKLENSTDEPDKIFVKSINFFHRPFTVNWWVVSFALFVIILFFLLGIGFYYYYRGSSKACSPQAGKSSVASVATSNRVPTASSSDPSVRIPKAPEGKQVIGNPQTKSVAKIKGTSQKPSNPAKPKKPKKSAKLSSNSKQKTNEAESSEEFSVREPEKPNGLNEMKPIENELTPKYKPIKATAKKRKKKILETLSTVFANTFKY